MSRSTTEKRVAEVNLSGKSNRLVRKIQAREKDKNQNPQFFDQFMS